MKILFSFLLAAFSICIAESEKYTIIEDRADLAILNPFLKERKTLKIRLANGLEAYLLSDPGAEQSAAALSIEAGSWDDPKEYPGMAHFLEHMIFMGTAPYPKEDEYMEYINDYGGTVNAATWPDHTTYMFSINNAGFLGAVDRFSHFFIDPLFSPSCINRELHAVDQEHSKNQEHDGYRQYMVFKETSNPNHPNAAFCTGNADTLKGIPQAAMKKWYQEHYSADKMHLVLISPMPIEQLAELAAEKFSKVASHATAAPIPFAPLFSSEQKGHLITIKPIKELRLLSLSWEIPHEMALDKERKASELIGYALGQEGENSLLAQLKREKIAETLRTTTERFSKDHLLFCIEIELTQYGLSQIDTALLHTFQALAQLKQTTLPSYLFEEIQSLATLHYAYQGRKDPFKFAMKTANEMLYEDLETFPRNTRIPSMYDPSFVQSFVQTLTPSTCFFTLITPSDIPHDRKEKWIGAEYSMREIPLEKLQAWENAAPNPNIGLPIANPYISKELELLPPSSLTAPELIADDEYGKIYAEQDEKYQIPKIATRFYFKSPLIDGSAKASALADLFLKSLEDSLSETLFFGDAAGLSASCSFVDLKLALSTEGYSEKTPLFLKKVVTAMKTMAVNKEQFDIFRHALQSDYENSLRELPLIQAKELLSTILFNDSPLAAEKLKALKAISFEEFDHFSKQLLSAAYTEGFLYGNLTIEQAKNLWNELKTTLNYTPYPKNLLPVKRILMLPEKQGPYMIVQQTPRQGNAVILLLEEGSFSFEKRAAQQILGQGIQEAFFDTLRTKQQTAYIVKAWDREEEKQLLQFFGVQSSTHDSRDLLARFELFIEDFNKNIEIKIPEERFETLRAMIITSLKRVPENLPAMTDYLTNLAFLRDADFDWLDKRIESLSALSYDQFKKWTHQFLSRENPRRLAILMEGSLSSENEFRYERISREDICELGTYVR